ncbi:hypothetical protein LTR07_001715 [Exophiala xenobiotica]|nr:hypothetical protein LTR41_002109 [Exophiala xenobiotica]KAK5425075.1 hypothetical protein LTR90_000666 [Exophiala xenobiotica]KAK5500972.1 hypothetical protein LTR26_000664 [Exophiala xenobiotica]KAK5506113.1 hypothetical protein LTR83_000665 [Exophiala xenobiotica]KAK5522817.1 hypothetical protein LTR21_000664 [Exophiala xenobiotica]
MTMSSRRVSQAPSPNVNLFCSQCDTQVGVFANEWTRLTSSYVYPAHQGKHFGTEIGNKTQVVPEGALQRAVQGCTLAEVFCKKCSAALGQYCKAAPTPEQRRMIDQYFYKLSKTYLKDSETNTIVDAVFGFSGDIVRSRTVRPSEPPRPSLPPPPRWSQTPMRPGQDNASSPYQMFADSQSRSYRPSPVQNAAYPDSPNAIGLQLGMEARLKGQEEKLAAQDQKIQQQDTQIRLLTSLLETLRSTVDDLKTTLKELKPQNTSPRNDPLDQNELARTLDAMLKGLQPTLPNTAEAERLRAENAAIKARVEKLESTGNLSRNSDESPNVLGKRKRPSALVEPRVPSLTDATRRHASPSFQPGSSFVQMPTPQSSNPSDHHSQNTSTMSRNSSPDEEQSGNVSQQYLQTTEDSVEQNELIAVSTPQQFVNYQDRQLSDQAREFDESSLQIEPENQAPVQTSTRARPARKSEQPAAQPVDHHQAPSSDEVAQGQDDGARQQTDVEVMEISFQDETADLGDFDTSFTQLLADNVEFSDEEQREALVPRTQDGEQAERQDEEAAATVVMEDGPSRQKQPPLAEPIADNDAAAESEPNKRPRTRRSIAARRLTDNALDGRSVAPEPAAVPKLMPRRLEPETFEVVTPMSHEEEMYRKKTKQPKPKVQYTAKILNKELKELGLEEWIDKDKKTPEYRKAVTEARKRQRERNKLVKLMSLGVSVPPTTEDGESLPSPSNLIQRSALSIDEAFQAATEALLESSTGQLRREITVPPATRNNTPRGYENYASAIQNHPSAIETQAAEPLSLSEADGMMTRKKQREEEIRRRDQLAKEAMEI